MLTYYTSVVILNTMRRVLEKVKEFKGKLKKIDLKRALRKSLALVPSKLPVGKLEFDAWADDIMDLYNTPKNDSVKFAIATMILHCDPTSAYKPKHYFGLSINKSMSNQVASVVIQELKAKQQAAMAEEAAKVAAELDVAKISSN